jgi:hypothetical protein
MSGVKDAALKYAEHGFSVIPVMKDKKPFLPWIEFQKRQATPEEIKEWFKRWPEANIGIVTGEISKTCVVDIDSKEGQQGFLKFLPDYQVMPTANTPRGFWHLYFKNPDKTLGNNAGAIPGVDFRGSGGYVVAPPSINGEGKGWEWQKGLSIFEVEPRALPQDYYELINYNTNRACGHLVDNARNMFTLGRRDEDLFHVANTLIKGGMPPEEALQLLEKLAKNCNPPFPENEIKIKVESAIQRAERREVNLAQEVREWVLSTTGPFFSTEVNFCPQLSTREGRKNLSEILRRLVVDRIIERYGNRNGYFRLIDRTAEEIDFVNASTESLWLHWPFQIERYVKTLPKNIIVIAGEPNSGKTALLLNFIKQNMQDHDIHYFSSEMGPIELRSRLEKFDIPLTDWKFTPKERSSNFSDVIKPDAINVIDYLEISDDFYRVGGMIREIYDKLKSGIAIIALQKNPNTDVGLGGMRSLEKARLYLAMEQGRLKIVKAKNWQTSLNPNGLGIDFKLVQGCKFVYENDWKKV